ncbi:hypothetical protein Ahia01_000230900 [Argonauta hians]
MDVNVSANRTLSNEDALHNISVRQVHIYLPAIVYLCVAMVVGTLGNACVTYLFHYKMRQTPAHRFIVILSTCDFLTCLICIPLDIVILTHPYVFYNDPACRIIRFLVMDFSVTSGVIVFAISIDRFKKVCLPLRKQFNLVQVGTISAVVIGVATFISLPGLYVYGTAKMDILNTSLTGSVCSISDKVPKPVAFAFVIFLMCVCLLLLTSFAVIYSCIGVKLCLYKKNRRTSYGLVTVKSVSFQDDPRELTNSNDYITENRKLQKAKEKFLHLNTNPHPNKPTERDAKIKAHVEADRKVSRSLEDRAEGSLRKPPEQHSPPSFMNMTRTTLIMFMVTLVWALSYIPHLVLVLMLSAKPNYKQTLSPSLSALFEVGLRSFYLNNTINPIVYGILNFQFRKELISLLHRAVSLCRCSKQQQQHQ